MVGVFRGRVGSESSVSCFCVVDGGFIYIGDVSECGFVVRVCLFYVLRVCFSFEF